MFIKHKQIEDVQYNIYLNTETGFFTCEVGDTQSESGCITLKSGYINWVEDMIEAYHLVRDLPRIRAIIVFGMTTNGIDYKEETLCRNNEGELVTTEGDTLLAEYVLHIDAKEALESIQTRIRALNKQREDLYGEYHAIEYHYKIPL